MSETEIKSEIERLEEFLKKKRLLYQHIYRREDYRWMLPIVKKTASEAISKIKRYQRILSPKKHRVGEITQSDIDRAKEFPIQNIVEIGRNGRARCVFHDGKDFNMGIKNNIARCFVCDSHGDSIEVYRRVNKCGFIEAVRALS